jgi:hypothetical protein
MARMVPRGSLRLQRVPNIDADSTRCMATHAERRFNGRDAAQAYTGIR